MEAVAFRIAPHARLIHLMHGLPEFNIVAAARTLETVRYVPVGIHVCICDPGVGTARKAIICCVARGDYLIGPDNGVLLPAASALGGIAKIYEITNTRLMNNPVSPLFHGRDVFVPAAAHLACGTRVDDFGLELAPDALHPPPYCDALPSQDQISAQVIQVNRFGSIHLNVTHEAWDSLDLPLGSIVRVTIGNERTISVPFHRTFGDVAPGAAVLLKDDYGRVEIAVNQGSFARNFSIAIGDRVTIDTTSTR